MLYTKLKKKIKKKLRITNTLALKKHTTTNTRRQITGSTLARHHGDIKP